MTDIVQLNIARRDLAGGVAQLCDDFHIPAKERQRVRDCLAHLDPRRFAIAYSAGAALAAERPYGRELRAIVARPDLTANLLYSLDHVACDEAGMLELLDRLGIMGMFAALDPHNPDRRGQNHIDSARREPRIAPLAPEHALPIMREALATVLNDLTGMKASRRRDFKRKKGQLRVVPGRMADFIQRALTVAGWDFSAEEIAENYGVVLMKREWKRHPRPRTRS